MKVIIYCAMTVDGKIARHTADPIDWTIKEDKKLFAWETKKAGVVIMGNNTFKSLGRPLKDRLNVVITSKRGREDLPGYLEFTNLKPNEILKTLKRRGFKKAFVIGGSQTNTFFLEENLADEIWLSLAPRIFGAGIGLITELQRELRLKLLSAKKISKGFVMLKYEVAKQ